MNIYREGSGNQTKNRDTVLMGEYVSTQTLVIHHWAGPSVIANSPLASSGSVGCGTSIPLERSERSPNRGT